MKNKANVINGIFIAFVILILCAGLVKTVFFPKDINLYENRYAEKIQKPSLEGLLDTSYQDSVEKAFSDQINFAQTYKKIYNQTDSEFIVNIMSDFINENKNIYINLLSCEIFGGDTVVYPIRSFETLTERFDNKIENINFQMSQNDNVDFYIYYIEKDTEINFETNKKIKAYEYLKKGINIDNENISCFEINSFDDFSKYFYKTDHHWSYEGSYKGYQEIMTMLGKESEIIKPTEKLKLDYKLSGSKVSSAGAKDVLSEDFYAYRFEYPDMEITINGKKLMITVSNRSILITNLIKFHMVYFMAEMMVR